MPRCPRCNSIVSDEILGGLCQGCLLKAGIEDLDDAPNIRVRCPHCAGPVEACPDSTLRDLACPACKERFSLVSEPIPEARSLGRFDLIDEVGSGGFGAVWRAHDRELDRTVAVKLAYRDRLTAFEAEDFFHEARATARLNHPGIVKVLELGYEDGQAFIVNEFIDGPNLGDWLAAHPLTPGEAARLCVEIAVALQHAHEAGIVHRDLKPTNILMGAGDEPYLVDFGLAKREPADTSITLDGRLLGTPAYMAPEQARGQANTVDQRADVYALGVILFEMLTGERPFRGNMTTLLRQVIEQDAPSPRSFNTAVPRDLETICLKCLEKDPRKRYTTAGALAEDLRRFVQGRPIQARPITAVARAWRWCVRNPLPAGMAAVLGGLLAVLAVAGPLVAVQQRNLARQHREARREAEEEQARTALVYRTAEEYYRRAIELLEKTVSDSPAGSEERRELAQIYNDLAWVLATSPDLEQHVVENAVDLARMALDHVPSKPEYRQTLGLAHYRAGQWELAIDALEGSLGATGQEQLPLAGLFLAMAHAQLGHQREARHWFEETMQADPTADSGHREALAAARQEALMLLTAPSPDAEP